MRLVGLPTVGAAAKIRAPHMTWIFRVVVDSGWIGRMREFGKRLVRGGRLGNPKAWLMLLIAANVAYVGVGVSSQGASATRLSERAPADLPSLRLVSEMSVIEPEVPVASADPLVCHSWGPFNNPEDFVETQERIAAAGGVSEIRQSVVFNAPDYLVYVGRPGEAENARRTLEELKSQSIESALIIRGPFNNTLSVGVFSRVERAEVQRERVAKLGYDAGIEKIDRSYAVFHLEGRVPLGFEPGEGFEPGDAANRSCADIARAH
jgi:hypothetical protein